MRVLLTGADGFVGSQLAAELGSRNLSALCTVFHSAANHAGDERIMDIRNAAEVEEIVGRSGADTLIHSAAVTSPSGPDSTEAIMATNVVGTQNVLEAARRAGIARVVFVSSEAVYGRGHSRLPVRENHPLRGEGPYARAKIQSEQDCRHLVHRHGMQVAICRLGSVYGPSEQVGPYRPRRSIPSRLVRAARGRGLRVAGGDYGRTYCHVADAARAIVKLASLGEIPSETFNLGGPCRITLSELCRIVVDRFPKLSIEWVSDKEQADIHMSAEDERGVLDMSRLRSRLGELSLRPIEQGMQDLFSGT